MCPGQGCDFCPVATTCVALFSVPPSLAARALTESVPLVVCDWHLGSGHLVHTQLSHTLSLCLHLSHFLSPFSSPSPLCLCPFVSRISCLPLSPSVCFHLLLSLLLSLSPSLPSFLPLSLFTGALSYVTGTAGLSATFADRQLASDDEKQLMDT